MDDLTIITEGEDTIIVITEADPEILEIVEAGRMGPPGPGTIISDEQPDVPSGESILWIRSGMGANNDQYGLYVVIGN